MMDQFVWGIIVGIAATMVADWALLAACRCKRCVARRAWQAQYDRNHPNG